MRNVSCALPTMKRSVIAALALAAVLVGCDNRKREEELREQQLQSERNREAARVDAIVRVQMSGSAESRGSTLVLVEPGPDVFRNEGELACGVAQLQLHDGFFDTIRLITLDLETRTEQERIRLSLPYRRPLPNGCELPPPGYYR